MENIYYTAYEISLESHTEGIS